MVELKVATFNIRCDTPDDHEKQWKYRAQQVIEFIKHKSWDIVGLQEVTPPQLKDLVAGLPEYSFCGISRENSPEHGEYNPIFYKKSRFELLETKTMWLAEVESQPNKSWDASYLRIMTTAKFKEKKNQKQLIFINSHFDHESLLARRKSAEKIVDKVQHFDCPVVFVGDLNAEPKEETITILQKELSLLWPDNLSDFKEDYFTFHDYFQSSQREAIDYIFVNQGIQPVLTKVLTWSSSDFQLSDHFPIQAIIML